MRLNNTLGPKAYKALYRAYSEWRTALCTCILLVHKQHMMHEQHQTGHSFLGLLDGTGSKQSTHWFRPHGCCRSRLILLRVMAQLTSAVHCIAGDETFTTALPHDPSLGILGPFVYAQVLMPCR